MMNTFYYTMEQAFKNLTSRKLQTCFLLFVTFLAMLLPYLGVLITGIYQSAFNQDMLQEPEDVYIAYMESAWYEGEGRDLLASALGEFTEASSVLFSVSKSVLTEDRLLQTEVHIVEEDASRFFPYELSQGRSFYSDEHSNGARVVMVSDSFAAQNGLSAVETDFIYLDGMPFEITGVFKDNGSTILLPLSAYQQWTANLQRQHYGVYFKIKPGKDAAYIEQLGQFQARMTGYITGAERVAEQQKSFQSAKVFLFIILTCIMIYSISNLASYIKFRNMASFPYDLIRHIMGAAKGWLIFRFIVEFIVLFVLSGVMMVALHIFMLPLVKEYYQVGFVFSTRDMLMYAGISFVVLLIIQLICLLPLWRLKELKPGDQLRGL